MSAASNANKAIIRDLVFSFGQMDEAAFTAFSEPWAPVAYRRKEILTREGETERYLYLVLSGLQRAYCLHKEKDATLVFTYPPSFSGVIDSFLLQQPSRYFLEATTDSSLLRISYDDVARLMLQHKSISDWVREALARVLADSLGRQIELLSYSAEERFRALMARSPHIINLVPHKHLASYIGIDATNFSKFLGKIRL